jgi:hypothetical protein
MSTALLKLLALMAGLAGDWQCSKQLFETGYATFGYLLSRSVKLRSTAFDSRFSQLRNTEYNFHELKKPVIFKALCYKPEVADSRPDEVN